jgi:hypothetical protein
MPILRLRVVSLCLNSLSLDFSEKSAASIFSVKVNRCTYIQHECTYVCMYVFMYACMYVCMRCA